MMKSPQKTKTAKKTVAPKAKPATNKKLKSDAVVRIDDVNMLNEEKKRVKTVDDEVTDAFIKEVDEDVQNDNLKVLWDKYGLFIILFVILAVSAAVGFDTIKGWREKQYQQQTEEYLTAVQAAENAENTLKALEKIAAGNHGVYSELARVQIANVLADQGKTEDAETMLQAIVDNEELSTRITHMAAVKLASYKLDTAPQEEIEALLKPVIEADDAWTPMAQDFLAMSAISNGNYEQAREIYESLLQNSEISENFKNRIQDMLSALSDM